MLTICCPSRDLLRYKFLPLACYCLLPKLIRSWIIPEERYTGDLVFLDVTFIYIQRKLMISLLRVKRLQITFRFSAVWNSFFEYFISCRCMNRIKMFNNWWYCIMQLIQLVNDDNDKWKWNTKINNITLSSYDVPFATAGSLKHEWYNDQKLKIESHCHIISMFKEEWDACMSDVGKVEKKIKYCRIGMYLCLS